MNINCFIYIYIYTYTNLYIYVYVYTYIYIYINIIVDKLGIMINNIISKPSRVRGPLDGSSAVLGRQARKPMYIYIYIERER